MPVSWTLIIITLIGVYPIKGLPSEAECYRQGRLILNMGFAENESVEHMFCVRQLHPVGKPILERGRNGK